MVDAVSEIVKIVVYVPETHAEKVREALGKNGAGKVGNYDYTSFSAKGIGRFLPLEAAHPAIGKIGELTEVLEERIESVCYEKDLEKIIKAVKEVHPYEEVVIDVYPLVPPPQTIERKK